MGIRTLDALIDAMAGAHVTFRVADAAVARAVSFEPDAVLFPPLLALTTLLVASARKNMRASEAPLWTAASLTEHFGGLGSLGPKLERSIAVRRRCADALVFLENANLVAVGGPPDRVVVCTKAGVTFVRRATTGTDDLGLLARALVRAHTRVVDRGSSLW